MEFEVPKTRIFSSADIYPLTWSDGFCSGRGKRGALVETGQGAHGRQMLFIINFDEIFGGREDEDKRTQDNG